MTIRRLVSARRRRVSDDRGSLLARLPVGSVGAEIGVWRGDFSRRILATVKPSRLYLVDPWRFVSEYPRAWYGGLDATSQEEMDAIHARVCSDLGGNPRVRLVRLGSIEAIAQLDPLDWAYIDGDHTFAAVSADLAGYCAILQQGGLLCGDDYGLAGWWEDGVTRAVDSFVRDHPGVELEVIGSQWLLRGVTR